MGDPSRAARHVIGAPAKLRIHWVVDGVTGNWADGWTSALASNRYRAILPATALRGRGHDVDLIQAESWQWPITDARPDVVVIGKLLPGRDPTRFNRISRALRMQAQAAVASGALVVGDFNDDHFDHPLLGEHWRELARIVGVCSVGSDAMGATVRRHTNRPVGVVGDPLGSLKGEPKVFSRQTVVSRLTRALLHTKGRQRLKFVWYGNPVNWPPMQSWANLLVPLARDQPFVVWIVTQQAEPIESFVQDYNHRHGPAALMELVPWDEATQWDVVSDADIVLLPSDPLDPRKAVKTSNRLTDAVHAGRYVIASPLPSYAPFADFVALTDDPLATVQAYLENGQGVIAKLHRGQAAAQARCGLDAVADEWGRVFLSRPSAAPSSEPPVTSAPTSPPVRLNLGCGDKILAGFVNVDLSNNWSGKEPDVVADVTGPLPFPDGHADEVHAYHVLEHLLRWKAEECIREWSRVLKPGGQLVLEMPCLNKIIGIYGEYAKRGEVPPPRLSLWALYGDPNYRAEPMMHRWCYSVTELTSLLNGLGMNNVREEEPRTHIKIRDMRLVCEKP